MLNLNRQLIGITVFISIMIFTDTAVKAFLYSPTEPERNMPAQAQPVSADLLPKRLVIPRLGIDANVQHVGLGQSGKMAVPYGYSDVGWYRYGPVPGQMGSAVIDGHVDNGFGLSGVFKNLQKAQPGDEILYTAEDGSRLVFTVESVAVYDEWDVPLHTIFNRKDAARLNLITCAGDWDEASKSYNKRVVVFAKLQ